MSESGLSALQVELAQLFFSLPESRGFLLAGGGALIAQGFVDRPTEDLDFFTSRGSGSVDAASDALVAAVSACGWRAELARSGPEFRRWIITGPEVLVVDLAVDSPPVGVPTVTILGPSIPPADLAVRKVLALFGRAEPRDFVDVYALNQHFDRDGTLSRAAESDRGFTVQAFAQSVRSHTRLDDDDFPNAGVMASALRSYFDAWADELESRSTND